jgi:hypothetical protein
LSGTGQAVTLEPADARLAVEVIVAGLPEVPALLVHNVEWLVGAYLPGRVPRYFEPRLSPDAEDVDAWGAWVVGWDKEK